MNKLESMECQPCHYCTLRHVLTNVYVIQKNVSSCLKNVKLRLIDKRKTHEHYFFPRFLDYPAFYVWPNQASCVTRTSEGDSVLRPPLAVTNNKSSFTMATRKAVERSAYIAFMLQLLL
jgi:hypothetical protein